MENKISIRNAKFAKIGLEDMLDYIDPKTTDIMLEIGSYVGDSTEIFAKRFDQVHCVDPWRNGYDEKDAASYKHDMKIIEAQFDELCKKYDNIKKHKYSSKEFYETYCDLYSNTELEHKFDMIYIDGLHTYEGVKSDREMYIHLVKPGGWLCGHDYQGRFPGTIKAVDEFQKPDKIFRDTSWAIRIK